MVRSQCGASGFYLMLHAASYAERRMLLATARMRFDTDDEFCRTSFYSGTLQIISLDRNALARPRGALITIITGASP